MEKTLVLVVPQNNPALPIRPGVGEDTADLTAEL